MPLHVLDSKDGSFHQKHKSGVNAQVQREPLTLVGRGHSSKSRVITAGPSGSSSGITRMRDCTTSNQPSSEENQVLLRYLMVPSSKYMDTRSNILQKVDQ